MAFVELTRKNNAGRGRDPLTNCVRAYVSSNGVMNITVSTDLHEQIGKPKACRVMVGTDAHEGKIAILPLKDKTQGTLNFNTTSKFAVSPRVQISSTRVGPKLSPRATTAMPFEVTDLGLIIDIRPLSKPVATLVAA